VLWVHGHNGAGKSTLLQALAGLLIHSGIVHRPAAMHHLGHHLPLRPHWRVTEHLALWQQLGGIAALPPFTLPPEKYAHQLSAGMRQQLALNLLAYRPAPLWLLDEPAAALDAASQAVLAQLITDYYSRGGMVVLVSHQPLDIVVHQQLTLTPAVPTRDIEQW
jgi:heme exporter protein A